MFSEAKKTVDYGFRRYRYLLAPYSLHTRARTNILGGLVIDWKLIQQTHTINDKMNYCMGGKLFQVQLRLLCPPDPSGTIKCSPPNMGQDKKYLVIKCLPWNKGRGQRFFPSQLKTIFTSRQNGEISQYVLQMTGKFMRKTICSIISWHLC